MSVTVAEMRSYDSSLSSRTDAEIQGAINAETAAQGRICRMPDPIPDDLTEALMRRVVCNLARRRLPLGMAQGDSERGPVPLPGRDSEVRRLEAPHRRRVVG